VSSSKAGPAAIGGFRLKLHRPGDAMDGWGLGLSSSASEKRHLGQIYAVLCADATRAAIWSCAPSKGGSEGNALRLRWGSEHRFLVEGAHDARLPWVRFVVLLDAGVPPPERRAWALGASMGCVHVRLLVDC
jgi:hypothetical protein